MCMRVYVCVLYTCMHLSMFVYMHVCVQVCFCINCDFNSICGSACSNLCKCTNTYVCMFTYVYMHLLHAKLLKQFEYSHSLLMTCNCNSLISFVLVFFPCVCEILLSRLVMSSRRLYMLHVYIIDTILNYV